jgi:hypothetical protein
MRMTPPAAGTIRITDRRKGAIRGDLTPVGGGDIA